MKKRIENAIKDCIGVKKALLDNRHVVRIQQMADEIVVALKNGGKVIIFGNGGSAADAQHMAAEFVGRFKKERKALPAISLTTNASTITAVSNDYSFDLSFKRQMEGLARANDIAFAISTSGNAKNVIEAVKKAKELKIKTISLTGRDGGNLSKLTDFSLIIPSNDTARIQEAHILIIHVLCELVEEAVG